MFLFPQSTVSISITCKKKKIQNQTNFYMFLTQMIFPFYPKTVIHANASRQWERTGEREECFIEMRVGFGRLKYNKKKKSDKKEEIFWGLNTNHRRVHVFSQSSERALLYTIAESAPLCLCGHSHRFPYWLLILSLSLSPPRARIQKHRHCSLCLPQSPMSCIMNLGQCSNIYRRSSKSFLRVYFLKFFKLNWVHFFIRSL